jgi:hypothetical protein
MKFPVMYYPFLTSLPFGLRVIWLKLCERLSELKEIIFSLQNQLTGSTILINVKM